jgi:hypothetical protein
VTTTTTAWRPKDRMDCHCQRRPVVVLLKQCGDTDLDQLQHLGNDVTVLLVGGVGPSSAHSHPPPP